ncbi:hypothetical protein NIASO_14840 [Niabella soli DSM 19437]|uniref:Uncharacterized protein n=1 Tax=Niabella soli DSM 19437 TaxID=929713 RepID=W0F7P4_9BACT|nr:hypothetical protein NIASO_14840 [Niabella soli DSM 19437]
MASRRFSIPFFALALSWAKLVERLKRPMVAAIKYDFFIFCFFKLKDLFIKN